MVIVKRIALMLVGVLLVGGLLVAQASTSKIIGTVTDSEGNALPGVTVEATSPKLVGKATAITDENGPSGLLNLHPAPTSWYSPCRVSRPHPGKHRR